MNKPITLEGYIIVSIIAMVLQTRTSLNLIVALDFISLEFYYNLVMSFNIIE